ncbi:hypothetical protein [Salinithrix halophila]|uniref:Cyclodeaminase/cyclohydrolase domain-containing protein n=1 Tax=Salinithrix halophila TaxID=1485204 RepID=A0ABV8JBX3_9BACL
MKYADLEVTRFADEMAQRRIPSPAAGSSLAVSLIMACSLLEMTVAEAEEKGKAPAGRQPGEDREQIQSWREEGKRLIDADIQAVEKMLREKGNGNPQELLAPVLRLHRLAVEAVETARDYLVFSGPKVSDTFTAFLHLRTVAAGAYHIACFNETFYDWKHPLPRDFGELLEGWDREAARALRETGDSVR